MLVGILVTVIKLLEGILLIVLLYLLYMIVGRTEPNLDDLGLAFEDHSIRLHELEDYVQHVEPISFAYKVYQTAVDC